MVEPLAIEMTLADQERFESKIDRSSSCHIWKAGKDKDGYGSVSIRGKNLGSHRVSFLIHHGEIPDGMQVLHRCDNPSCVNPGHLFLGTAKDNMVDREEKKRGGQLSGSRQGLSKLTEEDVREIRARYSFGKIGYIKLGKEFGVSHSNIVSIVNRETWKHVV